MLKKQYMQWATIINNTLLLVLLLFVRSVVAVDINVSADRTPAVKDEAFRLIFSATEAPDDDPDFAPLSAVVDVLNQQQSNQYSLVNGQSTKQLSWTLEVMPKVAGQLIIPAISFGDDATLPLTINVLANSPASNTSNNAELFVKVAVMPGKAYVQSQILYTIRMYKRVQISQASLTEPKLDNAIVEKLGEDKQFNTQINGVNYSVFERNYAIFPQQSGALTIPPIELTAQIVTGVPRSLFGSMFNNQQSQTKRARSRSVSINVLPIPDTFTAPHWLAAENIQLQQTWSNDNLTIPVGEPLTRTIILRGEGVSASQLPDLVTDFALADIKMYPDQPVLRDQKNQEGVIASRQQKIAIIPSKAGRYQIPAINIPWFNTKTHQIATAMIPAVTVIAVASTNSVAADVVLQTVATSIAADKDALSAKPTRYWRWAAIFFAIAWVATLIWIIVKRRDKKTSTDLNTAAQSQAVSLKDLRKACVENNPQAAMQALLNWAEAQYATRQLHELNLVIEDELQAEINRLNEALYANKKQAWQGSKLMQLVAESTKSKAVAAEITNSLQALHKI